MGSSNGGKKEPSGISDRFVALHLDDDQIKNILADRAATLAQVSKEDSEAAKSKQFVSFKIGAERFGVDVKYIEEIQPLQDLTIIPCTPEFVVGAVNIRGRITPVIDIKVFFDMPRSDVISQDKVIVLQVGEKHFGIIADNVEDVMNLETEEIGSQLATLSGAHEEFIQGVADSQIIILDVKKLANDRRMVVHENV